MATPVEISDIAPDASLAGPLPITQAEYRLPRQIDSTVLANRNTELWAQVYRPQNLSPNPLPILIFLHGNHATCGVPSTTPGGPRFDDTCEYTNTGTCPTGSVVVPSHTGYAYLAERLASWGYFVVSINANLGITCGQPAGGDTGLILARGRLVLRHLQELSRWNANGGTPASLGVDLRSRLDFSQVGLMGHSRGGEGVRAAYNLYKDNGSPWPNRILEPVEFKAVFEIAPVDGQSDRVLNAEGTPWAVLLPMCDGDISDLQGILPFDRMVTSQAALTVATASPPKSAITVWGANHNFYNTEWQESDSDGCRFHTPLWNGTAIGSASQRQTGLATLMAFFRAHVGNNTQADFARNMDGAFKLPLTASTLTRVDRTFVKIDQEQSTQFLETFNQTAPMGTSGQTHQLSQVTLTNSGLSPHDVSLRVGKIGWQNASDQTYIQFQVAAGTPGIDLSAMQSLDFDISRDENARNVLNIPTDFEIRLIDVLGRVSNPVVLSDYFLLVGPVGNTVTLPIVASVRLPLARFLGVDLSRILAVKWIFNRTTQGLINVANLRASDNLAPTLLSSPSLAPLLTNMSINSSGQEVTSAAEMKKGLLTSIKPISTVQAQGVGNNAQMSEITIYRENRFKVTNALPSLRIKDQIYYNGYFPEDGDTRRMIFVVPESEALSISKTQPATLQYGTDQTKAISIEP